MYAALLRTLGAPPRCEQFAEPTPSEGEVMVEVRAAALKPVDKQMAAGSHFASPANSLPSAAPMVSASSTTALECSSAGPGGRMAPWRSAP